MTMRVMPAVSKVKVWRWPTACATALRFQLGRAGITPESGRAAGVGVGCMLLLSGAVQALDEPPVRLATA